MGGTQTGFIHQGVLMERCCFLDLVVDRTTKSGTAAKVGSSVF